MSQGIQELAKEWRQLSRLAPDGTAFRFGGTRDPVRFARLMEITDLLAKEAVRRRINPDPLLLWRNTLSANAAAQAMVLVERVALEAVVIPTASDTPLPQSTLSQIAGLLRKLADQLNSTPDKHVMWAEERAGRYLMDAIKNGAFSGDRWRELRHDIQSRFDHGHGRNYANAFYGPVEWLQERGRLPKWSENADSSALFPLACDLIAQLLERHVTAPKSNAPHGPKAATVKTRRFRQPSDEASAAYRIWFATKGTQAAIAEVLSAQFRKPIRQNQVSRMLQQVKRFLKAGNVLPDPPRPPKRATTMDPSKMDLGDRQIARTARQRDRRIDD